MRVVALAGGTGSAKLLKGLAAVSTRLTVVANVGDNYWTHGLYVCPDVDIAMYALAGVSDEQRGWGIRGDTFTVLEQLRKLGEETWFRIGDRDIATSVVRTKLLTSGLTLTEATTRISKAFGVRHGVLPATDSEAETLMMTSSGRMHLQEYWVKNGGRPRVTSVAYKGASKARPSRRVSEEFSRADRVVLCPANPITSIGPILAIRGMKRILQGCGARIVALSPMFGKGPFSGPAGRLMKQLGIRPDSTGVAKLYSDLIDELVIDKLDAGLVRKIEETGVSCSTTDTMMRNSLDAKRIATFLLGT